MFVQFFELLDLIYGSMNILLGFKKKLHGYQSLNKFARGRGAGGYINLKKLGEKIEICDLHHVWLFSSMKME